MPHSILPHLLETSYMHHCSAQMYEEDLYKPFLFGLSSVFYRRKRASYNHLQAFSTDKGNHLPVFIQMLRAQIASVRPRHLWAHLSTSVYNQALVGL